MNNIKPYLPFGSMQYPRLLSRIRNAWVALITSPNRISIEILDDFSEHLDFKCPALTPCFRCTKQVQCSEQLKKLPNELV